MITQDLEFTAKRLQVSKPRPRFGLSSTTLQQIRETDRPESQHDPQLRIVDLFSGCGPFTLGAAAAASMFGLFPYVVLAVDSDQAAAEVFRANFPTATVKEQRVETLFDGDLGNPPTEIEMKTQELVGVANVVLGGPPCQGHSNLNNHTRRQDPRNSLYARMARAIEILKPEIALVENVPAVVHASEGVVCEAKRALRAADYAVTTATLNLQTLGIPQRRKRHVLVAASRESGIDPARAVNQVEESEHPHRTISWALYDLVGKTSDSAFDTPTNVSERNAERIDWLFENNELDLPNDLRPPCHQGEHSYSSMYGRLNWHEPAQTITTGFGSMGQGRYVHPLEKRTITAHEAARLQGIPDYFQFDAAINRTTMRRLIGNAVPPALPELIIQAILWELVAAIEQPEPTENESPRAGNDAVTIGDQCASAGT